MTASLGEIQLSAALSEYIYRRDDKDQSITYTDLKLQFVAFSDLSLPNDGSAYYNNQNGFVGSVFEDQTRIFVVFRGTDIAGSIPGLVSAKLGWGPNTTPSAPNDVAYDLGDASTNLSLGLGTFDRTQLDDALALTQAALDKANGKQVIVTGQSLGGGLASLVSGIKNAELISKNMTPVEVYAFDPAPFAIQLLYQAYANTAATAQISLPSTFLLTDVGQQKDYLISRYQFDDAQADKFITDVYSLYATFRNSVDKYLNIYRVEGEALSYGFISAIITAFGAQSFGEADVTYEAGSGDAVSLHSPALINLIVRTEPDTEGAGQAFSDLLAKDRQLRAAFLDTPGIVGPVDHTRADPDGSPSKVGSSGPNPTAVYNALWKSVNSDDKFYSYFYNVFDRLLTKGAAGQGSDGTASSVHSGLVKLALGVLRDDVADTSNLGEIEQKADYLFVGGTDSSAFTDKAVIHVTPLSSDPRLNDDNGLAYGVTELNQVLWDAVKTASGSSENAAQVLGKRLFEIIGTPAIPGGDVTPTIPASPGQGLGWEIVVAQAGSSDGPLNYTPLTTARVGTANPRPDSELSHLIIGGAGADIITGSTKKDFILGGNGSNVVHSSAGGDVVIGGSESDEFDVDDPAHLVDGLRFFGGGGNDTIRFNPVDPSRSDAIIVPRPKPISFDGGEGNDVFILDAKGASIKGVPQANPPVGPIPINIDGPPPIVPPLLSPVGKVPTTVLIGGVGNDQFIIKAGGAGTPITLIWGGGGSDTFDFEDTSDVTEVTIIRIPNATLDNILNIDFSNSSYGGIVLVNPDSSDKLEINGHIIGAFARVGSGGNSDLSLVNDYYDHNVRILTESNPVQEQKRQEDGGYNINEKYEIGDFSKRWTEVKESNFTYALHGNGFYANTEYSQTQAAGELSIGELNGDRGPLLRILGFVDGDAGITLEQGIDKEDHYRRETFDVDSWEEGVFQYDIYGNLTYIGSKPAQKSLFDTFSSDLFGNNLVDSSLLSHAHDLVFYAADNQLDPDAGDADPVTGTEGNDTLTGGPGNDVLQGGNGDDTYVYVRGGGNDTLDDPDADGGFDRLLLHGVASGEVSFERQGDDAVLVIAPGPSGEDGGRITLSHGMSADGNAGIDQVVFDDGATLSARDIRQMVIELDETPGDDVVVGTSDDDVLTGGLGNDVLQGGSGNDTYVYDRGDGNDTLDDPDAFGGHDTLTLHGVVQGELSWLRQGDDAVVMIAPSPAGSDCGRITLSREMSADFEAGIDQVVLDDGTTWSLTDIRQMVIAGSETSGDDLVLGTKGDDTLTGGLGNDVLQGGAGNDTYVYTAATDGNVVLDEQAYNFQNSSADKLILTDLALGDVALSRVGASNDLVLTVTATGHTATVRNIFDDAFGTIETLQFADGTSWNATQTKEALLATEVASAAGTIYGFEDSDDTLVAGTADRTLVGFSGNDSYVYTAATGGNVVIDDQAYDFQNSGSDRLVLADLAPDDVALSRDGASNDLVVTVKATGHTVTVRNIFNGGYGTFGAIEALQFADGTAWSVGDVEQHLLDQASAAPSGTIYGFAGDDTIAAGPGDKTLVGFSGNDTYVYDRGDGNDLLDDPDTYGGYDTLVLHGIATGEVSLEREGDDAILVIAASPAGGDGARITLAREMTTDGDAGIDRVEFDDGTSWSRTDLQARVNDATQGIHFGTIYDDFWDSADNGSIDLGRGNDVVRFVNAGDVTVLFRKGDGQDTYYANSNADLHSAKLKLTDINWNEVRFVLNPNYLHDGAIPNDIIMLVSSTGDAVNLGLENWAGRTAFDQILFADSISLSRAQVVAAAIYEGTGGNDDRVFGGSGTIDMLEGDDVVRFDVNNDPSEKGDVTVLFHKGDGHDTYYAGGVNDLQSGQLRLIGITPDEVELSINTVYNADVLVNIVSTGDTIDLGHERESQFGAFESIVFDNGEIWDRSIINARAGEIHGTMGNDTLNGTIYVDYIRGSKGDDILSGGYGSDTYVYERGDGNDIIDDNGDQSTGADRVLFGSDISPSDVIFSRSNTDLVINMADGSGRITISDGLWSSFNDPNYAIDQIENFDFADGTRVSIDTVKASLLNGGSGNDDIRGYRTSDTLNGNDGNDRLDGVDGDDRLIGGAGDDDLIGGAGSDSFVFGPAFGRDTIEDFQAAGTDHDVIEFDHAVYADASSALAAFSQIGSDVVVTSSPADTILVRNTQIASITDANIRIT